MLKTGYKLFCKNYFIEKVQNKILIKNNNNNYAASSSESFLPILENTLSGIA